MYCTCNFRQLTCGRKKSKSYWTCLRLRFSSLAVSFRSFSSSVLKAYFTSKVTVSQDFVGICFLHESNPSIGFHGYLTCLSQICTVGLWRKKQRLRISWKSLENIKHWTVQYDLLKTPFSLRKHGQNCTSFTTIMFCITTANMVLSTVQGHGYPGEEVLELFSKYDGTVCITHL